MSELAPVFADKILRALDRIVALLDDLNDGEAAWTPTPSGTSSIAGIANHILANVEENVLGVIAGRSEPRGREGEFSPPGVAAVRERWAALRPRLEAAFAQLDDRALKTECQHPRRGAITIAEMLIVIRGHIGEHEGQAALTRDLILSRR